MQPLPLNALRVFESVVRLDSFRAAADELCVSQSAKSHQIRHLEDWFEDPLFDRSGNRPRPLPHAQRLAFSLEGSFEEISLACQRARCRPDTSPLVIADITVNESFNYYLVEHTDSDATTQSSRDAFKSWLFEVRDADALPSNRHV